MHAAVLHELGATPVCEAFEDPVAGDEQVVVEVALAGVNPVDVRKASGTFVSGPPPVPSVVGTEGVGRLAGDGRRVYFDAPIAPFGSYAERALVGAQDPIELPDGIDDGVAVALGISGLAAWVALAWRAQLRPGETVLVLGATGVVGQIAVQAARLLGAGRVVAAGRDAEMLARAARLGADATVDLSGGLEGADLTQAFREAAGGDVDVVHDPLWGPPAAAALEALGVGGRLVQLGQSAGAHATLSSASIRGRHLDVRGYMNFLVPADVRRDAYRALVEHAAAERIEVEVERVPLADVGEAWERVQRSAHRKLVLVP
jgi:NADPH:quinone reductase-like Zn-dependent oxidoreductase